MNFVHKDTEVNLCTTYEVGNTHRGKHVMILDPDVLISLAGRPWLQIYIAEFDNTIEDTISSQCDQVIQFWRN